MNTKTVKISGIDVPLKTSAYTPLLYAELFNANIFADMQEIVVTANQTGTVPFEKVLTLYRLAYCMAKHADSSIPTIEKWLDQFDVYDIPEITGDLIELWAADNKTQSTPKDEAKGD